MINKENIVYNDRLFPCLELWDFETLDDCHVPHGVFISEDFLNCQEIESLNYRLIDNQIYGYLPGEFIEKCTEKQAREYIKKYIG